MSGRNSANRQILTELDFLKSDTIGSQIRFDYSIAAYGVMSPAKLENVP